jgi:hypothetical protein
MIGDRVTSVGRSVVEAMLERGVKTPLATDLRLVRPDGGGLCLDRPAISAALSVAERGGCDVPGDSR